MTLSKNEINTIGDYIMPKTPLKPVDIAIVFGTSYKCDVFADHIYSLWAKKTFKQIILTGAPIAREQSIKESLYLKKLLIEKGIPSNIIITEEKSMNTGENIEFSLPFLLELEKQGFSLDPILGIGKVFASRRCLMTMEKHLPNTKKIFSPINTFSGVVLEKWQDFPKFVDHILKEYNKIPKYIKEGFIVEIDLNEELNKEKTRSKPSQNY